jgi:hypothetical protein
LDGLPELSGIIPDRHEYRVFYDSIDTAIMGNNNTFQEFRNTDVEWPYGDKSTYVLSRYKNNLPLEDKWLVRGFFDFTAKKRCFVAKTSHSVSYFQIAFSDELFLSSNKLNDMSNVKVNSIIGGYRHTALFYGLSVLIPRCCLFWLHTSSSGIKSCFSSGNMSYKLAFLRQSDKNGIFAPKKTGYRLWQTIH